MKFWRLGSIVLLCGVICFLGNGCGKESPQETDELAAKVEDWTFTKEELEQNIATFNESQKRLYDSPTGRVKLTDLYIDDELFHLEGKRLGLQEREDVKEMIENGIKRIIVTEYYKSYIEDKARPSEEEMREYYELHQDEFTSQEVARARHLFSKSKEKIYEMKRRIDEGEDFGTLITKFSEDELTKKDVGDLGYFNPGGYIRFVGFDEAFNDAVFALEKGEISDPVEWERGYSIILLVERRPEALEPFEDVKGRISTILMRRRVDAVKAEVVADLKERYDYTNYMRQAITRVHRTPEELWNLAQATTDSNERIILYQEIHQRFPDSDYAPQALFMVGFVYAEELKDPSTADRAFNQVIVEYPGSDVAKSAEWMLNNLNKPLPDFQDLDELHKAIAGDDEESK